MATITGLLHSFNSSSPKAMYVALVALGGIAPLLVATGSAQYARVR